jgi:hypothetical protein
MARSAQWDWLERPAAQRPGEFSETARLGLLFARLCRESGLSARRLAGSGVHYRGRPLTARRVQRAILIARLQVQRANRVCEVCGRRLLPRRQHGTRTCSDACRARAVRSRRRRLDAGDS